MDKKIIRTFFAGLFVLVLFSGCARTQSPVAAYLKIVENANKGNWEYVYLNIDEYSRGVINTSLKIMADLAHTFKGDRAKKKEYASGKERFIAMCTNQEIVAENFKKNNPKVTLSRITGTTAYLDVQEENKEPDKVVMHFEDRRWKIHIEE
ncbi:MAG: hypothetical protein PHU91_02090 [Candidatus Omnitrophica bacterium]|nr:hypothetical protein [Candidatus Omnitrophota bacterium]MDD5236445.1 hypothetical protein [Candidatus Omnitrophota bacterium]MDD5610747.1 hypothetical protein [Candidatus Omnitrophota bacterium]